MATAMYQSGKIVWEEMIRTTPQTTANQGPEQEPPYRCPVSTPANVTRPSNRVGRTKSMNLEIPVAQLPSPRRSFGGKVLSMASLPPSRQNPHNSEWFTAGNRVGRLNAKDSGRGFLSASLNGKGVNYYYVDKAEDFREQTRVNTFWLKALCAQPVPEILDKYKRRSDCRKTRFFWSKDYTTPGEKSLIRAWERNTSKSLASVPRGSGGKASSETKPPSAIPDDRAEQNQTNDHVVTRKEEKQDLTVPSSDVTLDSGTQTQLTPLVRPASRNPREPKLGKTVQLSFPNLIKEKRAKTNPEMKLRHLLSDSLLPQIDRTEGSIQW